MAAAQAVGLGESHSSFKAEKERDEAEKAFGGVNLGWAAGIPSAPTDSCDSPLPNLLSSTPS